MGKSTLRKLGEAVLGTLSIPHRTLIVLVSYAFSVLSTVCAVPFVLVTYLASLRQMDVVDFYHRYAPYPLYRWGTLKSIPRYVGIGSLKYLLVYVSKVLLRTVLQLTSVLGAWLVWVVMCCLVAVQWVLQLGQGSFKESTDAVRDVLGELLNKANYTRKIKSIFKG